MVCDCAVLWRETAVSLYQRTRLGRFYRRCKDNVKVDLRHWSELK
jgi:hypothetical protein